MYTIKDDKEFDKEQEIFIIDATMEEYYCTSCMAMFELECCCNENDEFEL